jgi:hypothetical protein
VDTLVDIDLTPRHPALLVPPRNPHAHNASSGIPFAPRSGPASNSLPDSLLFRVNFGQVAHDRPASVNGRPARSLLAPR